MSGQALAALGIAAFAMLFLWIGVRAVRCRARLPVREALWLAVPVAGLGFVIALSGGAAAAGAPAGLAFAAAFDGLQLFAFSAVGIEAARRLGREPLAIRMGLGAGILAGLNFAAWSALVFRVGGIDPGWAGASPSPPGWVVLALLRAAVAEELLYRLGIQWHLARAFSRFGFGAHGALVATAVLWTLVHLGSLEPAWVRGLQLLPMGLVLGVLSRRFGVASCVVAHALFNLSTLIPGLVPTPSG